MFLQPPRPTLFPYTTLFRSHQPASSGTSNAETSPSPPSAPAAYKPGTPKRGGGRISVARKDPSWGKLKVRSTRSEEHTSELQSRPHLVCRLLLEKKKRSYGE